VAESLRVTTPPAKARSFYGSRTYPPRWTQVRVQVCSKQHSNRGQS
jgi:hypothetical protein